MARGFLTIPEAARRLGRSERRVQQMCIAGEIVGAVKRDGRWRVPESFVGECLAAESGGDLAGLPKDKQDEASRRKSVLDAFEKFASESMRQGVTRMQAIEKYCAANGLAVRTLQRWLQRYRQIGVRGLADARGFSGQREPISVEAWEVFKSLYLTERRLSVAVCLQDIIYINKTEAKGWQIPSLRYMQELVKKQIPYPTQVLLREGMAAYEARCQVYTEKDFSSIEPGTVWVGDHHQCNVWVRHRGSWVRPWVTAWTDMRSRTVMGWCVSTSPNQITIMRSLKRGIESYGPPESVKIDNGKDYDSEMWTGTTKKQRREAKRIKVEVDEPLVAGLYSLLGISVSFAIPYHPQSKPIERFFDTLDIQFSKAFATYCGKDSARKPEQLNDYLASAKAIGEAYDLPTFERTFVEYVEAYNMTAHRGEGMDGMAPLDVLATRSSRRVMNESVIPLLCQAWTRPQRVGKNGVVLNNIRYGQASLDLLMHQDKLVRLAYDPDDMSVVYVYDAATLQLITAAEQNKLVAYGEEVSRDDLAEAMRMKSRAVKALKSHVNHALTANMDLVDLSIKAKRDAAESARAELQEAAAAPSLEMNLTSLKAVRTPLDDQVGKHRELKLKLEKRKAVGDDTQAPLTMDLTQLKPKAADPPKITLFGK